MKTKLLPHLGLLMLAAASMLPFARSAETPDLQIFDCGSPPRPSPAVKPAVSQPSAPETARVDATQHPRVEVAFVLDTTGSMGGLIQTAKEKIWAIANSLISTKPTPQLKMALVGYRDRGDVYITKTTDFTDDLDAVYKDLMNFTADGGGDEPESVNQALHEAVTKLAWSQDKSTYRVIFLVGDAPPHMDYKDDVKYEVSCKTAAEHGIYVNTIQCGSIADTVKFWKDIAQRGEGQYFRVEQSGGAILAATPYDERLSVLAKKLDETVLYYGGADDQAKAVTKTANAREVYANASLAAQAQRCEFNSKEGGKWNRAGGGKDLVQDISDKKADLAKVKEDELPADLKKLSATERENVVHEKQQQREAIQKEIKELSEKRLEHQRKEMAGEEKKGRSNLDQKIFECIRSQAALKGLKYDGGPSL